MLSSAVASTMFYVLAGFAVISAIAVVCSRRILRAAVYLMCLLVASAGFYILLGAEFLAGVQVLVYVGGIVVLLVFAIMITRSAEVPEDKPTLLRKSLGLLAAGSFFVVTVTILLLADFPALRDSALKGSETAEIGRRLLDRGSSGYLLPFEVISFLLLSVAIGGIVLARKLRPKGGE